MPVETVFRVADWDGEAQNWEDWQQQGVGRG